MAGVTRRLLDHVDEDPAQAERRALAPAGRHGQGLEPVLGQATLDRLSELAPASRFTVDRFRPNVVVDGVDAFAENDWGSGAKLEIGGVLAAGLIPTMRCIMTTLAQADLPRDNGVLRAIAAHNRIEITGMGTWSCVGAYATVTTPGRIAVGDDVTVS